MSRTSKSGFSLSRWWTSSRSSMATRRTNSQGLPRACSPAECTDTIRCLWTTSMLLRPKSLPERRRRRRSRSGFCSRVTKPNLGHDDLHVVRTAVDFYCPFINISTVQINMCLSSMVEFFLSRRHVHKVTIMIKSVAASTNKGWSFGPFEPHIMVGDGTRRISDIPLATRLNGQEVVQNGRVFSNSAFPLSFPLNDVVDLSCVRRQLVIDAGDHVGPPKVQDQLGPLDHLRDPGHQLQLLWQHRDVGPRLTTRTPNDKNFFVNL